MTLDIDRIKKTSLGRAWLSRFVELVWERVMDTVLRRRMVQVRQHTQGRGEVYRLIGDMLVDPSLKELGLVFGRTARGRRLTPLGVEVYLHGRRAGQRP
jgi:hypothetical protein